MTTLSVYDPGLDMLSDGAVLPVMPEWSGEPVGSKRDRRTPWLERARLALHPEPMWRSGGHRPDWLDDAVLRLARLLELEPDWDSYGARAVSIAAADTALVLLLGLAGPETPAPHIVPTPAGGVQIEWHTPRLDLEVEIRSPTRVFVGYEFSDTGEEGEFPVTSDFRHLADLVSGLTDERR
ncbi:MAG TPA: hypothetical protein VF188_01795 [Longimicrobiales bacterium]